MKILFAGKTGFDYNRTKVLYKGLQKIKSVDVEIFKLESKNKFDKKRFKELTKNTDFIYIPPFRFKDARFFKKQTNIPIIFDPLVSVYLTKVIDYKQYWKAPQKYIADKRNLKACDILIADTQHHKKYFSSKFGIPENKIFVLPIGVDTEYFYPVQKEKVNEKFHVGFYGSFIPLQGTDKIIEAARILKDNNEIIFDIIGDGYNYNSILKLSQKYKLNNINFHGRVSYEKLPELINAFDISLGIFGESLKADIVIPNKVYHYSAVKKCVITKDTPGIREIFTNNDNIILTSTKPGDIAEKILFLKNNKSKRELIATNAYNKISSEYNEIKIAEKFIEICSKYSHRVCQ